MICFLSMVCGLSMIEVIPSQTQQLLQWKSLDCCLHNLVSCEFYSWTMGQVLLGKCLESLHGVIE